MLARRVWPDGRTRAYVCGRSATVADLRELGARLLAFYGQHEHRRLMLGSSQLEILDALGGAGAGRAARQRSASATRRSVRCAAAGGTSSRASPGRGSASSTCCCSSCGEIDDVAPSPAEQAELARRARAAAPRRAAPSRGRRRGGGARSARGRGRGRAVAGAAGEPRDGGRRRSRARRPCRARCRRCATRPRISAPSCAPTSTASSRLPGRLEQVEERLAEFARLSRKHGGGIDEVLAHAERCRDRRDRARARGGRAGVDRPASSGGRGTQPTERAGGRAHRPPAPMRRPSSRRRWSGGSSELAMPDARFSVAARPRARRAAGPRGADTVEFSLAPNAGPAGGPAARDRLRRRALPGDAGAAERRPRCRAAGTALPPSSRCSCSTRSTPGSAATPPGRSEPSCARSRPGARSSASPTCRRWRRSAPATSRSPSGSSSAPALTTVTALDGDERRRGARADAGGRGGRPRRQPARPPACCARRDRGAPSSICAVVAGRRPLRPSPTLP